MDIHRCRVQEFDALRNFWFLHRTGAGLEQPSPEEVQRLHHETFENPFAKREGTSWLAWEQNRPVAHLRESPCPAYYHGQRLESGWWQGFYALHDSHAASRRNAAALLALKVAGQRHGHAMLGTPGVESRVFKLYQRMHFDYWGAVPFFYFVVDGAKLLRNLFTFKRTRLLAEVANAASYLYVPGKLLALRHWRLRPSVSLFRVDAWQRFPSDADLVWKNVLRQHPLIFERSTQYLNWRYFGPCYERLGVFFENRMLGWVVCKTSQMKGNKYFGNLKVGTIIDLLVDPDNANDVQAILCAGLDRLVSRGADLIVTNLSDRRLARAACRLGFAAGPSNFHFFTKNLPKLDIEECHLTRGDSDGDGRL